MDKEHKTLKRVILFCYDFARQLSYHNAIQEFRDQEDNRFHLNFWQTVSNNNIDLAVLEWCYFFKSHKDELHWKNVVDDIDGFRDELLDHLKLNFNKWNTYRDSIAYYRDKCLAHHELRDRFDIPDMTIALSAVVYYYSHVVDKLPNMRMYDNIPYDLMEFYSKSTEQSKIILNVAFKSTEHINEDAYFHSF